MNSVEMISSKAKSGVWGLDDILSGGRAMSIIKKRTGAHESTAREYRINSRSHTLGEPLDGFQGAPIHVGEGRPLLQEQGA